MKWQESPGSLQTGRREVGGRHLHLDEIYHLVIAHLDVPAQTRALMSPTD